MFKSGNCEICGKHTGNVMVDYRANGNHVIYLCDKHFKLYGNFSICADERIRQLISLERKEKLEKLLS